MATKKGIQYGARGPAWNVHTEFVELAMKLNEVVHVGDVSLHAFGGTELMRQQFYSQ